MRAQFVRGIDPKDSMNIGNKHAREAQKMIAVFKEVDPDLEPKQTEDKTVNDQEVVIVSVFSGTNKLFQTRYSLAWIKSGLEYYMLSWDKTLEDKGQETFKTLEKVKEKFKKVYRKN